MSKAHLYIFFLLSKLCLGHRKVFFMELQHSMVDSYDRSFYKDPTFTSHRFKRDNPIYFMTMTTTLLKPIDNSVKINVYVYELLSNVYKRSFIEVHANFCDFMNYDNLFSRSVKSTDYMPFTRCPLSPGYYHLDNMTAPYGPFLKSFPFKQGRIYINITKGDKDIVAGHIDMRIKESTPKDFYKHINN